MRLRMPASDVRMDNGLTLDHAVWIDVETEPRETASDYPSAAREIEAPSNWRESHGDEG